MACCSNVDFPTLDGPSSANVSEGSLAPYSENECTTTSLIRGTTSDYDPHPTEGLSFVRQQLKRETEAEVHEPITRSVLEVFNFEIGDAYGIDLGCEGTDLTFIIVFQCYC